MKSTRKHELHTNALADFLGHAYEDAKPHANVIGYAALGLAIVVLAYILVVRPLWMGSEKDTGTSGAMARAMAAGSSEAMKAFLAANSGAPQAPAARLIFANRLLAEAVRSGSATTAAATLAEAKSQYELVARSSAALEPLANVGLALVTIQEGDLEKGVAALEEIVKKDPSSLASVKAKENIERLKGYKPIEFSNDPPDAVPSEPGVPRMPGAMLGALPVPAAPTPSAATLTLPGAATPSTDTWIPRSLIPGQP